MPRSGPHVSPNRLEGSLCDVSFAKLTDECRRHLITGTIRVEVDGSTGVAELRAGVVDHAEFGELQGEQAVARMLELSSGLYQLTQRLPDLTGALGDAAQCQGDLADVPLAAIMRHCEDQALSCTITVVSDFDRGEIGYRVGEIVEVTMNGVRDEDAIVDIVRFQKGRFRVTAAPLALDIDGWPSVSADPTGPFRIEEGADGRGGAAAKAAAEAAARAAAEAKAPAKTAAEAEAKGAAEAKAAAAAAAETETETEAETETETEAEAGAETEAEAEDGAGAEAEDGAVAADPAPEADGRSMGVAGFVLLGLAMLLLSALVWTIAVKL